MSTTNELRAKLRPRCFKGELHDGETVTRRVLDAVLVSAAPVGRAYVSTTTGIPLITVDGTLQRLRTMGKIMKAGYGAWARPDLGLPPGGWPERHRAERSHSHRPRVTHGHTRKCTGTTSEYSAWRGMRARVKPTYRSHSDYYDRGIRVCERWASSFENFLADMGPKPADRESLDRINNDGNYEPGNCRWATRQQQNLNMTRTRYLTAGGTTLPMAEWARRAGINVRTLYGRISAGWSHDDALFRPVTRAPLAVGGSK